ncbi:MAG TPA: FUSC family protein [Marmoricola sp.]|nr:FUSC family protein [Marmoricola sp.]
MSEPAPWDQMWSRGRMSGRARLDRLRAKGWHIGQASVAAGVAWFLASEVFGHPTPFFAPVAAVVSLGTSYGQRWRRVLEVTLGVAIGVFVADLLVLALGSGWWQLTVIVVLSMSVALLLDAGGLFVTQAAVQSIVVATFVPEPGQALLRWTDALIGGGVALVAATVVPGAPLRRPREQAAVVLDKISFLLAGAADGIEGGDVDSTLDLLADARSTDVLVLELRQAASEGLSVIRSSPFRVRHKAGVRKVAELVEPLDLAIRNTRVLVRRVAVAAYRRDPVPQAYARLCRDLADAVDEVAAELRAERIPTSVQPRLVRIAAASSQVDRTGDLSGEVILAQLRSVVADLLRITGMGSLEATDAIPPLR